MIVWTSLSHHKKTRVRLVEFYGSYGNSRKAAYTSIYRQASDGAEIAGNKSYTVFQQLRNFAISVAAARIRNLMLSLSSLSLPLSSLSLPISSPSLSLSSLSLFIYLYLSPSLLFLSSLSLSLVALLSVTF